MTDSPKFSQTDLNAGVDELTASFKLLVSKYGGASALVGAHLGQFRMALSAGARCRSSADVAAMCEALNVNEQHFVMTLAELMDISLVNVEAVAAGVEDQARRIGADIAEKLGTEKPVIIIPQHRLKPLGETDG